MIHDPTHTLGLVGLPIEIVHATGASLRIGEPVSAARGTSMRDQHAPRRRCVLVEDAGFADRRLIKATHAHDLLVIGHHKMPVLDAVVWGNITPLVGREAVGDLAVVPALASHRHDN